MMSNIKYSILFLVAFTVLFTACQQPGGNSPGSEFMPDMAHSIAYEANVNTNYYHNTWDEASVKTLKELSTPGLPVKGTIPRGHAGSADPSHHNGTATTNAISIPVNGSVPYYYKDTDEERARAMNEIIVNPFPIDSHSMVKAKALYEIQCGICHGDNGDGNGWLVDEKNVNAKYEAQPAIFLQDTFYNSSNGRFYHSIMHGKGVMGGYADKLSYKERWDVIHYIRSLMAQALEKEYSHMANTYTSNAADKPCCPNGQWRHDAAKMAMGAGQDSGAGHGGGGHDGDGEHVEDSGHDGDTGHEDGHDHDGEGDHDH